jgi:uncharacterized integral membrane protein
VSVSRSDRAPDQGIGAEPPPAPEAPAREATAPETTAPEPTAEAGSAAREPTTQIPRTKTATAYNALIGGAIVLVLLLVFILENTESVHIAYFGLGFHVPLGVALLLAAIAGALIMGIVGTARIVQLRRHVRRAR